MTKLIAPPVSLLDRYHGSSFEPVYATKVMVTGGEARHGRASGSVRSDDGELELELRLPVAMGGEGGGTNPEQLFAAGYGACFHGALSLLATKHHIEIPDLAVEVEVAFGRDPVDGQHTLTAHVIVRLPGLDLKVAQQLVRATERICPYAKLVRQGIESSVRVVV